MTSSGSPVWCLLFFPFENEAAAVPVVFVAPVQMGFRLGASAWKKGS